MTVFNDTLTQAVGMAQATLVCQTAVSLDDIGVSPVPNVVRAQPGVAADTVGIAASVAALRGVVMVERFRIAHAQIINHKFHLSAQDTAELSATLLGARNVLLTDGLGVALAQQAQQAIAVIEALALTQTTGAAMFYRKSVAETVRIADSLANFFGVDFSDGATISDVMGGSAVKAALLESGVGIAESIAPHLVIRVTASDEVAVEAGDALRMIFSPALTDGIELSAAYISPGGSVTTWAMNTRTAAVTEYSNYDFNSFAQIGNRYVGASSEGLYELTGDDDDGEDIIAQIKSGFAQWAGSRFTMFKGAYLGVRGGGEYVLKLTTGDGKTYNYAVSARDMRSTKINIGKGVRTRYFAFELISAGQDFDLDTIEFVPLVAERRV